MSHPLHELSVEELTAEIKRRKEGEVKALRSQIEEHKRAIADLERKIAEHSGEKPTTVTRARHAKIDPDEADRRVLEFLGAHGSPVSISKISAAVSIGPALKASLARLESAGKIKRSGKARGTVYGVA